MWGGSLRRDTGEKGVTRLIVAVALVTAVSLGCGLEWSEKETAD